MRESYSVCCFHWTLLLRYLVDFVVQISPPLSFDSVAHTYPCILFLSWDLMGKSTPATPTDSGNQHRLWEYLGNGQVTTITDIAAEHYERTKRPLWIAVDEAHWRHRNVSAAQVYAIRQRK